VNCQSENILRSSCVLLHILSQHLLKGLKIGTETARVSDILSREHNPVYLTHEAKLLTIKLLHSVSFVRLEFKLLFS
jgi:hypothetical protein